MGFFDRFRKQDDLSREIEEHERNRPAVAPTYPSGQAVMPIQDIFVITGRGIVVTGQIAQGTFRVGDNVEIIRDGVTIVGTTITGIEASRNLLAEASAGENVGLLLRGVEKGILSPGDLICTARIV